MVIQTKFCIFCGAAPSKKTREHVIPQWLLNLTGSPNRKARFGRDWLSSDLKERIYSWSAFAFPACNACNSEWSNLEATVKSALIRMLNGESVSAGDFYLLLDWFDKVRIGLWLGMLYLNKNYRGIIPQFHINDRVGQKDRALIIFEADERNQGIGLGGIDTPVFHTSPSVCFIEINHLTFVSVSSDFLLAKALGWPILTNMKSRDVDTDGFFADIQKGTERITPPVLDPMPESSGCILLQPIAHQFMRKQSPDAFREHYSNDYVKASSIDPEKGVGTVLIGNLNPVPYPTSTSDQWRPKLKYPRDLLIRDLSLWSAQFQKRLFLNTLPDYSHFPEEDRIHRDKEIHGIIAIQDLFIKHILEGGL